MQMQQAGVACVAQAPVEQIEQYVLGRGGCRSKGKEGTCVQMHCPSHSARAYRKWTALWCPRRMTQPSWSYGLGPRPKRSPWPLRRRLRTKKKKIKNTCKKNELEKAACVCVHVRWVRGFRWPVRRRLIYKKVGRSYSLCCPRLPCAPRTATNACASSRLIQLTFFCHDSGARMGSTGSIGGMGARVVVSCTLVDNQAVGWPPQQRVPARTQVSGPMSSSARRYCPGRGIRAFCSPCQLCSGGRRDRLQARTRYRELQGHARTWWKQPAHNRLSRGGVDSIRGRTPAARRLRRQGETRCGSEYSCV